MFFKKKSIWQEVKHASKEAAKESLTGGAVEVFLHPGYYVLAIICLTLFAPIIIGAIGLLFQLQLIILMFPQQTALVLLGTVGVSWGIHSKVGDWKKEKERREIREQALSELDDD